MLVCMHTASCQHVSAFFTLGGSTCAAHNRLNLLQCADPIGNLTFDLEGGTYGADGNTTFVRLTWRMGHTNALTIRNGTYDLRGPSGSTALFRLSRAERVTFLVNPAPCPPAYPRSALCLGHRCDVTWEECTLLQISNAPTSSSRRRGSSGHSARRSSDQGYDYDDDHDDQGYPDDDEDDEDPWDRPDLDGGQCLVSMSPGARFVARRCTFKVHRRMLHVKGAALQMLSCTLDATGFDEAYDGVVGALIMVGCGACAALPSWLLASASFYRACVHRQRSACQSRNNIV